MVPLNRDSTSGEDLNVQRPWGLEIGSSTALLIVLVSLIAL